MSPRGFGHLGLDEVRRSNLDAILVTGVINLAFCLSKKVSMVGLPPFVMRANIHPKYAEAEIRCACGNIIKTRSTRSSLLIGICNMCHPFYTGTQKFVDTAGRVDKFQQRM